MISDEEESSQRVTRVGRRKGEPLEKTSQAGGSGSKFIADSDTNTLSCSETDNTAGRKARQYLKDEVSGKFVPKTKKKRSVGELTIEEMLRSPPW